MKYSEFRIMYMKKTTKIQFIDCHCNKEAAVFFSVEVNH